LPVGWQLTGRARRKEYWMFTLLNGIILVVFAILDSALSVGLLSPLY
jgi:uncharacterized membrane protein YhaH (DUF805 family)